jgi:23S rRNA maturation mini-RNase III
VNPSGRSKSDRNPIDGHNLNELILCFVGDFSTVFYKWATALELLIVYFFISGQQ